MSMLKIHFENLMLNLRYLPTDIEIVSKNVKRAVEDRAEQKKVDKKEMKNASAAHKENKDEENIDFERMLRNIRAKAQGDDFKTLYLIQNARKSSEIIKYVIYYITDKDAQLISGMNQDKRKFVNGIAAIYEFGKVYVDSEIADLRVSDPEYEEFDEDSKFLICIDELMKKREDTYFMNKVEQKRKLIHPKMTHEEKNNMRRDLKKYTKGADTKNKEHMTGQDFGIMAEEKVEYVLKWLPKERYICIDKKTKGIRLIKPSFINESQEIDHIVISDQGVIIVETKYTPGKVYIDERHNWSCDKYIEKEKKWIREGMTDPAGQVSRHFELLKSILEIDEIYSIICYANEKTIIEGEENSLFPVVKIDKLSHHIKTYKNKTGRVFTREEMEQLKSKIEKYRIKNE